MPHCHPSYQLPGLPAMAVHHLPLPLPLLIAPAPSPAATCQAKVTSYPDFLSADCLDFIKAALQKKAALRPGAAQLLDHPWLRAHRAASSAPLPRRQLNSLKQLIHATWWVVGGWVAAQVAGSLPAGGGVFPSVVLL